ncbi:MAG: hypothetical protein RMN51_01975 [Verrucomicrobiota bacterium]|nr:DUF799 domain-containing protein [Limisphaera sp.]MDW8380866.1 hypothetical protein [Verrucomicrobiota bacterium]
MRGRELRFDRFGAGIPFWLATWLLMTGSAAAGQFPQWFSKVQSRPLNVYRASPVLPSDLQRVAVLPLSCALPHLDPDTQRSLEEALHQGLIRNGFAEVRPIRSTDLKKWTGRPTWSLDQPLPTDFFQKIREATGADAVLFVEVTVFRAYRPVTLGWRLRLVDARSGCTWWAADEVFDTADFRVIRAARQFEEPDRWHVFRRSGGDGWRTLQVPRELARMTVAWLATTLPARCSFD